MNVELLSTDGSQTKDDNKGISSITYNVLGKPLVVTFSGTPTKTITYTYDAAGNKLKMVTLANSVTTTTDYVGGFVYTNNTLSFFSSPEGRVVKNGSNYEYQYAIADHQGNTRVLFSSASAPAQPVLATFEGDANDQANQYTNVNNVVPFGSANHTPGGSKVVRMNQTVKVGPSKSLRVYPGDKVDMEVWAYHESSSGNGTTTQSLTTMITAVAGVFGGVSGGIGESGSIYNGINSAFNAFGLGGSAGDTQPSAYLNYILVDKDYKLLDMGWTRVPATAFVKHSLSIPQIVIKQAGFIFVYLSYEGLSNNYVYFDDMKVTYTPTNIVQYNEYYPFGLQTANSWTRENNTGNNFLANGGTELNTTSNLYDLQFRNYDPTLGRMNQVDPMATKYASLTPYNYSFNDPVNFNDPLGDEAGSLADWDRLGKSIDRANRMNENRREAEGWRANVRAMYGVVGDDDLFPRYGVSSSGSMNDYINNRQFNNGLISLAKTFGLAFINQASEGWLIPKWSIKYKDYEDGVTQFISATLIGFESLDPQQQMNGGDHWWFDDKQGEIIGMHWLMGSGKPLFLSDQSWSDYMEENSVIRGTIAGILHDDARTRRVSGTHVQRIAIELVENDRRSGYGMLHGTLYFDYAFKATILNSKQIEYSCTFMWNDRIDPSAKQGDTPWVSAAKLFYNPKDYDITIKWTNTYIIDR